MISPSTKNLSHRHLINQKTSELYYYHQCIGKSNKIVSSRAVDITHQPKPDNKQHETSINLEKSDESSLSKKINKGKENVSRQNLLDVQANVQAVKLNLRKRSNQRNYKSVEPVPKKKPSLSKAQTSFSVRKQLKTQITPSNSQPKLASLQSLQLPQSSKKIQTFEPAILKSETDLKMTLKKASASKLKLRVKDPFEKRIKLDMQFKDQSMIEKGQISMMSTLNQQEFKDILSKMQ